MYTLKLILVKNFSSLGCFFIFIHCYKLSSAVDSCWQLMTANMKKIDWNFYIHTKVYTCAECQLSRLIFIFISCQQLLSAFNSWWQLMTADESWNDKNLTGLFIYTLKFILVPNFSSLGWFSFSSAVNNCWQLLTADDCWYKKICLEFLLTH